MEYQLFSAKSSYSPEYLIFKNSSLGQFRQTLPLQEMGLKFPEKKTRVGRPGWFDVIGGLALQFLKHRYKVSDAKLVELVNGSSHLQFFCGISLKFNEQIKDKDIVGRWRSFFGLHIDLKELQKTIADYWFVYMEQKESNLSDATCYESHVRYPTDVKLLWESCCWIWKHIKLLGRGLRIKCPKIHFGRQKKKQLSYALKRRKTYKETRRRQKSLLYLLRQELEHLDYLLMHWGMSISPIKLHVWFWERLATIKKVLEQQQFHYDEPQAPVKDRIVSLAKPYLRPIVRGKETKRVEFGAKVQKMQVSGLSFLEHFSFDAFNEGTRLESTVYLHQHLFGKCAHVGADNIYATNKNRRFCTANGIVTSFKRKGRAGKNEDQRLLMQKILGKARSTLMEGSFGVDKNHYMLDRIKARCAHTELAWIFFGIMTASASVVANRVKSPP